MLAELDVEFLIEGPLFVMWKDKSSWWFGHSNPCSLTLYQMTKFSTGPNWKHLQTTWNLAKSLKFVLGRIENIVGKGETDGYQHFLLFPQCFKRASILGSLKVGIVWWRINDSDSKPCSLLLYNTTQKGQLSNSYYHHGPLVLFPFWKL